MDTARLIEITARGGNNDSRSVRIYNERRMTQVLPFGDQAIGYSAAVETSNRLRVASFLRRSTTWWSFSARKSILQAASR
jgi:hypothetical protein